jgi:methylglutaconyl-CoA hydratase
VARPLNPPLVRTSVDDDIATVRLDSPTNRNALSVALLEQLAGALELIASLEPRALVLTHVGPVFCAGADLRERSSESPPMPRHGAAMHDVLATLMDAPWPTIAEVRGPVRAGGIGLMAACDLVVVRTDVTFAFTEVRIGVAPAIISVPVLARTNASHVASAFLTGEVFDAHRALGIGLVTHVAADDTAVRSTVDGLCAGVLAGGPRAVAATKRLLRSGADHRDRLVEMAAMSDALFASDEAAEGMAAFLDKRSPSWQTGAV